MERIDIPDMRAPQNPQLIINGQDTYPLKEPLINIGRSRDNHIVLDDPYSSRHHAQLRLRFGVYTLFDTQSQGGIMVNDVIVREHRLQAGDVIKLGKTQMVYLEDSPHLQTETVDPIDLL
jgi:pSer/pThr/pTyr-binding forkhead associated (FHA) protein